MKRFQCNTCFIFIHATKYLLYTTPYCFEALLSSLSRRCRAGCATFVHFATSGDFFPTSGDFFQTSGDFFETSGDFFETSGDFFETSGDFFQTSGDFFETSGDFSIIFSVVIKT